LSIWLHFFKNDLTDLQKQEAEELLPSLLKSYLKLGSKVLARPAFDRDFDCLDFLTVLKRNELSASIDRKFNVNK
jgi:putative hemolysin